jgi:NifU-like protein involved in Fe-S cluster formation
MGSSTLYTREILRLATALPHDDRLDNPIGSATCRSPVCGSEVTAEVLLDDGHIRTVAFRARACALGQASAALLREQAPGLNMADIAKARAALAAFLEGGDAAVLPWEALTHFAAARDHPARHGAILLPYDALLAAMAQVR